MGKIDPDFKLFLGFSVKCQCPICGLIFFNGALVIKPGFTVRSVFQHSAYLFSINPVTTGVVNSHFTGSECQCRCDVQQQKCKPYHDCNFKFQDCSSLKYRYRFRFMPSPTSLCNKDGGK